MGSSSYSDAAARHIYAARSTKSVMDVFTNTADGKLDPALDPKGVKVRESRDSDAHPESNAVMVFFDETGSMGGIPRDFAFKTMPGMMRLLTTKAYIPDPQVFFGAIGDAHNEEIAPLQVGQFESGLEMDQWLTKIFLEGSGGGQNRESYELALYFAARHTSIDCFEKRGKKGYLFIIGDEQAYDFVSKDEVQEYLGETIEANIPIKQILAEAQEKYEVFRICVATGGYPDGSLKYWKNLLGERALLLKDPDHVCELIGATIGACEGRDLEEVASDLVATGSTKAAAAAATGALSTFTGGASLAKPGTVVGDLPTAGAVKSTTKRL